MASERSAEQRGRCAAADMWGLRLARQRFHSPAAERAVARLSRAGEYGAVWFAIGAAGVVVDRRRSAQWRAAGRTVAGAYALNTALKLLARRRRPALSDAPPLIGTPTQLSFPSAHAATSFAG